MQSRFEQSGVGAGNKIICCPGFFPIVSPSVVCRYMGISKIEIDLYAKLLEFSVLHLVRAR